MPFICHRCGYADSPEWKNMPWRRYTSYCHIDELSDEELKKLIISKGNVRIPPYKYHLTDSGYVHRIAIRDSRNPKSEDITEPPMEKPKDPFQRKLLEVSK